MSSIEALRTVASCSNRAEWLPPAETELKWSLASAEFELPRSTQPHLHTSRSPQSRPGYGLRPGTEANPQDVADARGSLAMKKGSRWGSVLAKTQIGSSKRSTTQRNGAYAMADCRHTAHCCFAAAYFYAARRQHYVLFASILFWFFEWE